MTDKDETMATDERGTANGPEKKSGRWRWVKWGVVFVLFVACGVGGYLYYLHKKHYPSTSDAYIKANTVHVAPDVAGQVVAAPLDDQQRVKKGDLLLRIDPRPYRYQVAEAKAQLKSAKEMVATETAAVKAAEASIRARKATLTNAEATYKRTKDLVAQGNAPQSKLDDDRASLRSARANLDLARAQLTAARKMLGQTGPGNTRIRKAQAALSKARFELAHTEIDADCDGQISGFSVQPGDVLQIGKNVGVLVCTNRFWVYANYKETDITRIRPGQVATISVDMYPGHKFHGIVESLDPASGAAFSLLPPENATGNWVKVTQRVPVRILVLNDNTNFPLRVQTSTSVTLNTGDGAQPLGLARGITLDNKDAEKVAEEKGLISTPVTADLSPETR